MEKIKKILFYNDSSMFGGHEIMSVKIANILSSFTDYKIGFMFYNKKIKQLLNDSIEIYINEYRDIVPLPFIRNLNVFKIHKIKNKIIKINPDVVVICQGNIELSLKGLIASKIAKKTTISYIPFGNSFSEINANLSYVRDIINKNYYLLPDCFITPNNFQKELIKTQLNHENIFTILNPISHKNKKSAHFKTNKVISLAIIGRIDFKHKNQAISIEIASSLLMKKIDFQFHILGDGKDLCKLKSLVSKNKLSKYFNFYGWIEGEEKNRILNECVDIILIPSKFETGIPLVVYDALYNNKKFLLSKIKSIKSYPIPEQFLLDISDLDSIIDKIVDINILEHESEYEDFKKYIYNEFCEDKFKKQIRFTFERILCGH